MTRGERGFLLLASRLGDPARRPLTGPQLRSLTLLMQHIPPENGDADLTEEDLRRFGAAPEVCRRVPELLQDQALLDAYLKHAQRAGIIPVTRLSAQYPARLKQALGADAPACLWARGDLSLLSLEAVSLVGSRDLSDANGDFAREIGYQAARQGYALVSGNARGADREAQQAALFCDGKVISVVADSLWDHREKASVLYLSEDDYDAPFSSQRALRRNRVIHSLGEVTFVAQCSLGTGGTWSGTVHNLEGRQSPVFCFPDGSDAMAELVQRGAQWAESSLLSDFRSLRESQLSFYDA